MVFIVKPEHLQISVRIELHVGAACVRLLRKFMQSARSLQNFDSAEQANRFPAERDLPARRIGVSSPHYPRSFPDFFIGSSFERS